MASFIYKPWKLREWSPGSNLSTVTFKLLIVLSNTTADTDGVTAAQVSDIGTLDETTGTGYTAGGVSLTNVSFDLDPSNNRARMRADPVTFSAVGADSSGRAPAGFLLIAFNSTTSASYVVAFYDVPFVANGSPVVCNWNGGNVMTKS